MSSKLKSASSSNLGDDVSPTQIDEDESSSSSSVVDEEEVIVKGSLILIFLKKLPLFLLAIFQAFTAKRLPRIIIKSWLAILCIQYILRLCVENGFYFDAIAIPMFALAYSDDIFWLRKEGEYDFGNVDMARRVIIAFIFWAVYWTFRLLWIIVKMILPSVNDIISFYDLLTSSVAKNKNK
jgi:hypothetical protein